VVRCAIYTRKSSEDGLEQDFNSLDAQRESAENFIASQKHAGWVSAAGRVHNPFRPSGAPGAVAMLTMAGLLAGRRWR